MTMEKSLSEMESDNSMDDAAYQSITVLFKKETLIEEENLKEVWKKEVEQVFESKGLSCELKWDEEEMTVSATPRTKFSCPLDDIVCRGGRALYVLTCGLGTQYLEPILSGEIYSDVMKVVIPDGMSEDDFLSKYHDFINKVERKYELSQKLSCFILYHTKSVVVLSDKAGSTSIIRNLVNSCLNDDDPFDEDHFRDLFLEDI